ncbi:helix-turn-helix domain-containing protein [Anaerobacillus isosaccharinicus]|uniref:Helix-turn-helix domain-containing protein n=1 Tax=Anaerobacillus isosaccharinicus TaxID=1532552 RepID=A0A7S7RCL9_9BACI|nr:helix-turn-helix transcriptional regulator [Anaerobacillus isosaccharinicus]
MDKKKKEQAERKQIKAEFSYILASLRHELGYSQERLAAESKLDSKTIGRLETRETGPEVRTILKLAQGLKVSPGFLMDLLAEKINLDELDE